MRDTFIDCLTKLAEKDKKIVLITADLGFGVLDKFRNNYPERFINVGIAEQNMIGIASGLALNGYKTFLYSIGNFPTMRCLEQIRNCVCYHELDVKIISVGAGFSYGQLGFSHHATEDIAICRPIPNLKIYSPADTYEVNKICNAVIKDNGPAYIRLDKSKRSDNNKLELVDDFDDGKLRVIRNGSDICIFSTGGITGEVERAAVRLKEYGIETNIISVHSVKPLDVDGVKKIFEKFSIVFTVEEHTIFGGMGSALAELLACSVHRPDVFENIGIRDEFSKIVGTQDYLRKEYCIDSVGIVNKVLKYFPDAKL